MAVGTIEPIIEPDEVPQRVPLARRRLFGGGSGRGGGGDGGRNGGGGGGGDGRSRSEDEIDDSTVPDKAKFVTWFLLLVVLMTFGGLIGAYVVISTNGAAEWRPFDLPVQVWISTSLIILSSITYQIGKDALFRDDHARAKKFFIATTALGAAFISSQMMLWLALVNKGFYMRGNPYAGFFYILTAAHAVHVAGGIIALGVILLRTWNPTPYGPENIYRRGLARSVGWYWHFMGLLWLVLFTLLGFWK